MANEKGFGLVLEYSEEERKRANDYCAKVIDLLKPLSIKEKWLVADTLKNAFPLDRLLKALEWK